MHHAKTMLSRTVYAQGQGSGHRLIPLDTGVIEAVRRGEMTQREAAKTLGVSARTIRNRLDGGRRLREDQAKLRAARKALWRQQRDAEARKAKGPLADSYALVRRALSRLDQAHQESTARETRTAISTAMGRLHGVEDEIVKAMQAESIAESPMYVPKPPTVAEIMAMLSECGDDRGLTAFDNHEAAKAA